MHSIYAEKVQIHPPTVTHGFSRNLILIIDVILI